MKKVITHELFTIQRRFFFDALDIPPFCPGKSKAA